MTTVLSIDHNQAIGTTATMRASDNSTKAGGGSILTGFGDDWQQHYYQCPSSIVADNTMLGLDRALSSLTPNVTANIAGNHRSENIPVGVSLTANTERWLVFEYRAPQIGGNPGHQGPFQMKTSGAPDAGSPVMGISMDSSSMYLTDASNDEKHFLGAPPRSSWSVFAIGMYVTTSTSAAWVKCYRRDDGQAQGTVVMAKETWNSRRTTTGGSSLTNNIVTGTMFPEGSSNYIKFGNYRTATTASTFESRFGKIRVFSTEAEAVTFMNSGGTSNNSGPVGDLNWKGYNWVKRTGPAGSPGVGTWSAGNITGPDTNGWLTFNMSGQAGCELDSTRQGFGYGTYQIVTNAAFSSMAPNAVWGGLFTYDNTMSNSTGHNEIDVCETSAWGGGTVHVDNTYFNSTHTQANGGGVSAYPAGQSVSTVAPGTGDNTYEMVWESGKITWNWYTGAGSSKAIKQTAVATSNIPVPNQESLCINLWPFGGSAGTVAVVVKDVSFTPLGTLTPPVGDFTWSPGSPTTGTVTTFTATATPAGGKSITGYTWTSDGNVFGGNSNVATISYQNAATKNVQVMITQSDGASATVSHNVPVTASTVALPPTASWTFSPASPTAGVDLVTLNGSASAPASGQSITSWSWDFDGFAQQAGQTTTITFQNPGPKVVTLTVTQTDGQTATLQKTITVVAASTGVPRPAFTMLPATVPIGGNVTLDASATVPATGQTITGYSWSDGTTDIGTGRQLATSFTTAGTHRITLLVTQSDNQTASVARDLVVSSAVAVDPVDVSLTNVANGGTGTLRWNSSSTSNLAALPYQILSGNDRNGPWTQIATIADTAYPVSGGAPGSTWYAVQVIDADGNQSDISNPVLLPADMTEDARREVGDGQVRIYWKTPDAAEDVQEVHIYKHAPTTSYGGLPVYIGTGTPNPNDATEMMWTDTDVTNGVTVYHTIKFAR